MAFCQQCGTEFLTTPEEERLIITKAIAEVCMKCAMAGVQVEEDPLKLPMPPLWPRRKFLKTQIIRVDLRNPGGEVVTFIAMEPGPYFQKYRERKRPIHRPRVTILGNPSSGREPDYVHIITNIVRFAEEDRDLFAMKVPSMWDAATGAGEIRIERRRVQKVEHAENGVLATLVDGHTVAGYYPLEGEFKYVAFP
jgi:hypothetical protein